MCYISSSKKLLLCSFCFFKLYILYENFQSVFIVECTREICICFVDYKTNNLNGTSDEILLHTGGTLKRDDFKGEKCKISADKSKVIVCSETMNKMFHSKDKC